MSRKNQGRKGSALILTTVVVVVVAGLAIAFMTIGFYYNVFTFKASESERAFAVAEAGLDDAVYKLNGFAKFTWKGNDEDTLEQFNIPGGISTTQPTSPSVVTVPSTGYETYVYLMSGFDNSKDFADINKIYITGTNPDGTVGTQNRLAGSISGGNFTTTISPAYQGRRDYVVSCVGTHGQERRAISITVTPALIMGLGDFGLFAKASLYIDAETTKVDSYKSTSGDYNPENTYNGQTYARNQGNVGSNTNVQVLNGYIFGSVNSPQSAGSVFTVDPGAYVAGNIDRVDPIDVPDYVYSVPATAPAAVRFPAAPGPLASGTYHYTDIRRGSNDPPIKISGNVVMYVDGRIDLNSATSFEFQNQDATLTIYQGNAGFKTTSHSQVFGVEARTNRFQLYSAATGDGNKVLVSGQGAVHGMIYAPNATYHQQSSDSKVFGKVVANYIQVSGNTEFHRDEDVQTAPKPPPEFKIKYWKEYNP